MPAGEDKEEERMRRREEGEVEKRGAKRVLYVVRTA